MLGRNTPEQKPQIGKHTEHCRALQWRCLALRESLQESVDILRCNDHMVPPVRSKGRKAIMLLQCQGLPEALSAHAPTSHTMRFSSVAKAGATWFCKIKH